MNTICNILFNQKIKVSIACEIFINYLPQKHILKQRINAYYNSVNRKKKETNNFIATVMLVEGCTIRDIFGKKINSTILTEGCIRQNACIVESFNQQRRFHSCLYIRGWSLLIFYISCLSWNDIKTFLSI